MKVTSFQFETLRQLRDGLDSLSGKALDSLVTLEDSDGSAFELTLYGQALPDGSTTFDSELSLVPSPGLMTQPAPKPVERVVYVVTEHYDCEDSIEGVYLNEDDAAAFVDMRNAQQFEQVHGYAAADSAQVDAWLERDPYLGAWSCGYTAQAVKR